MQRYSEEIKRLVWDKAKSVDGFNPAIYRKDACGAWILWDCYGMQDNIYGWEIDHVIPRSILEGKGVPQNLIDDPRNLRAMQHSNNESKADDYPSYVSAVTSDGNANVIYHKTLRINDKLRAELSALYKL